VTLSTENECEMQAIYIVFNQKKFPRHPAEIYISPVRPVPLFNASNKKVLLRDVKTNNIPVERL
jgi:hypothetical protein